MEKNPNAVVTLQNRCIADGWEGTVTIVPADMREWEASEQADILVRWGVLCCCGAAAAVALLGCWAAGLPEQPCMVHHTSSRLAWTHLTRFALVPSPPNSPQRAAGLVWRQRAVARVPGRRTALPPPRRRVYPPSLHLAAAAHHGAQAVERRAGELVLSRR